MRFKRSVERMREIERRLRDGMTARGIVGRTADDIVRAITSFALYSCAGPGSSVPFSPLSTVANAQEAAETADERGIAARCSSFGFTLRFLQDRLQRTRSVACLPDQPGVYAPCDAALQMPAER